MGLLPWACVWPLQHISSCLESYDHGKGRHACKPVLVVQGQLPAAISHLKRVLEISREIGDHVGDADAHGTIADIYTDMGQFDKAAKCYDQYIQTMSNDGPV